MNDAFHPEPARCVVEACRSLQELTPVFAELIRERRQEPGEDLISLMVAGEAYGEDLSEEALSDGPFSVFRRPEAVPLSVAHP